MFSQLITNGDFRYNVDGWTASNSANTATWSDGKIRITANTAIDRDWETYKPRVSMYIVL